MVRVSSKQDIHGKGQEAKSELNPFSRSKRKIIRCQGVWRSNNGTNELADPTKRYRSRIVDPQLGGLCAEIFFCTRYIHALAPVRDEARTTWPWVNIPYAQEHQPILTEKEKKTKMSGALTPKWDPIGFDPQPHGLCTLQDQKTRSTDGSGLLVELAKGNRGKNPPPFAQVTWKK